MSRIPCPGLFKLELLTKRGKKQLKFIILLQKVPTGLGVTGIECPAWGPTYPQNTAQSAISRLRFSSASPRR